MKKLLGVHLQKKKVGTLDAFSHRNYVDQHVHCATVSERSELT